MSVMVIIWSTLSSMFHSFYLMEFKHWSFSYHLEMQRHCCYFLNPNAANNFNNFGCVCISDYPVYYLFQGFHISMHAHWIGHWPTIEVKSIRSNLAVNYLFIEFNEVIIFIYLFIDCCSLFFWPNKSGDSGRFWRIAQCNFCVVHTGLRTSKMAEIPTLWNWNFHLAFFAFRSMPMRLDFYNLCSLCVDLN